RSQAFPSATLVYGTGSTCPPLTGKTITIDGGNCSAVPVRSGLVAYRTAGACALSSVQPPDHRRTAREQRDGKRAARLRYARLELREIPETFLVFERERPIAKLQRV